jgi:hypothetical protein
MTYYSLSFQARSDRELDTGEYEDCSDEAADVTIKQYGDKWLYIKNGKIIKVETIVNTGESVKSTEVPPKPLREVLPHSEEEAGVVSVEAYIQPAAYIH